MYGLIASDTVPESSATSVYGTPLVVCRSLRLRPSFLQVEGRSVFQLDIRAPLPGHQAKAGFQRQIGNCLLPCFAGRLFVLLASRNAHIALDITEADDLRIGGIGIMLSRMNMAFLLQIFAGIAIENLLKLRQGLRFISLHQRGERQ